MKFKEDEFLKDVMDYIKGTYGEHYNNTGGDQTIEYIQSLDDKNTLIFHKGNAIKYISRYGKKAGHNKKDLMKAMHYICFMYYYAQEEENSKENV